MKRLDAYVKITLAEARELAAGAIAGIGRARRSRAAEAADMFARRTMRPRGLLRQPWHATEAEARTWLEVRHREIRSGGRICWDNEEYDYWWAKECLHADQLRAAKALLESCRSTEGKGRYVLINPEDMAEMRAIAREVLSE